MNLTQLHDFMAQHKLGVVATVNSANKSQSALIGIAISPALEIIFDTVQSSRKYGNLVSNPACSCVIGWTGEQTVQYEGAAQELAGRELVQYQDMYFEVWPECRAHQSWPEIVYFVVKPKWIRYSDFEQSPPRIREFTF